jgi:hypothetical protein
MKSPFPGMDPYIEGCCWGDFHSVFIQCWREAVADRLPDGFDAEITEYVSVVTPEQRSRRISPDVLVIRTDESDVSKPATVGANLEESGIAVLEPVEMELEYLDRVKWPFVEIRRLADERVIAVLELLSPSNKSGEDRLEYLRKRESVLRSESHLVELDLLLGGRRLPMHEDLPPGDYFAFVSRSDRRPKCKVYAWGLQRPLPVIPVPLIEPYADVLVALSGVFATAYQRGRYYRRLKYKDAALAPVQQPLANWVRKTADAGPRH